MKIIIDSREKSAFTFADITPKPETEIATLKTGDYTLLGFESQLCIERKSLSDLFGSCGQNRTRFEKEFIRMSQYRFAALVIEADWHSIYTFPPNRSKMDPKNILRTLIAWHMRHRVAVWPCPGRAFAERLTYLLLKRFYDDVQCGKIICDDEPF